MPMTTMQAEKLTDINGKGRERPWGYHKTMNEYIAMAYDTVNPDKAERLRTCATSLMFDIDLFGKKHLASAWFCRVRLCPMCTWRRSLKVGAQTRDILAAIAASDQPLAYIFLTLTVKNCEPDKLSGEIDALMQGFNRFNRQLPFKRAVKGWYRGLEVTHNIDRESESFDTFHPHFHCLLAVNPSYFTDKHYLSHAEWVRMWRQAMRLDYDPVVNVKRVKGDTAPAVAEAAKYSVKAQDIIIPDDWDMTVDTLRVVDAALDGRRLVAFGGRLKEEHKRLNLDDAEDGDLVHTSQDMGQDGWKRVSFAWYSGYRQYRREE